MAQEEALAAVRSSARNSGTSFQVIRELDSNSAMQEAAERSLHAASTNHLSLYGKGILLDLMKAGGFLILEVDGKSGNAVSIHLVSKEADGHAVIESRPIEGKVSAPLAGELIKQTADLVDLLFASSIKVTTLESRFYCGRFPESHQPDEDESQNLFAIPYGMGKAGVDQHDVDDLTVLLGAVDVWAIRYAISTPTFPADPYRALGSAFEKREVLIREFTAINKEAPEISHEPAASSEEVRKRVASLRHFSNFLEQELASQDASASFAANRSISTVVLDLGSVEAPENTSYAVMTASGIIVDWKISSNGSLVVARLALAGD